MKKEISCGAVIFNKDKFLIIRSHPEYGGHWDFVKGHMEEGETEPETTLREIREEVGLKVELLPEFKEILSYFDGIRNNDKIVTYFLAQAPTDQVKILPQEVADFAWLGYEDALNKLTYDNSKNILKKAYSFLKRKHLSS